tara:strand:- start:546 stop:764 length:219 start_codon:yes stop_codon:yes gene_type:complete
VLEKVPPQMGKTRNISLGSATSLAAGAVERSRTPDLLITNQLLYQLSYNSKILVSKDYRGLEYAGQIEAKKS